MRGYTPRRFSFNVPGGRCEACEGNGQMCIEMHFLPDVWVECETCRGRRYNPETLAVTYHGQSIADVLDMSCGKAVKLFENIPKIRRILQTLCDVGLDYLTLGQAAPTLSGGEAQRVKLAAELARPDTGRTLYLLDEPTTGLHFDDIAKLLDVLNRLVDLGNSVVVIEHNLDVIKTADWVIDMGPEAGDGGGYVVACGTPEDIVGACQASRSAGGNGARLRSHTGEVLAETLAEQPPREAASCYDFAAEEEQARRRPGHRRGRQRLAHAVGSRRPPLAHAGSRRSQGRTLPLGRPHPGKDRRPDSRPRTSSAPSTGTPARVVEIASPTKSEGWFFHAITGEEWLLKLKFRVAKNTFKRETLVEQLELQPAQRTGRPAGLRQRTAREVQEPPRTVPGSAAAGPLAGRRSTQPAFWKFLDDAIAGFDKFTSRVRQNPEDVMPWKVLGQKWHFARKGFPPGKPPKWDVDVLEELCEMLKETAPDGQFLWNNQQVVHLYAQGLRTSRGPRCTPSAWPGRPGAQRAQGALRPGSRQRSGRRARVSGRRRTRLRCDCTSARTTILTAATCVSSWPSTWPAWPSEEAAAGALT